MIKIFNPSRDQTFHKIIFINFLININKKYLKITHLNKLLFILFIWNVTRKIIDKFWKYTWIVFNF